MLRLRPTRPLALRDEQRRRDWPICGTKRSDCEMCMQEMLRDPYLSRNWDAIVTHLKGCVLYPQATRSPPRRIHADSSKPDVTSQCRPARFVHSRITLSPQQHFGRRAPLVAQRYQTRVFRFIPFCTRDVRGADDGDGLHALEHCFDDQYWRDHLVSDRAECVAGCGWYATQVC